MNIGNVSIKGNVALAPMAGVTDQAFRQICSKFGVAFFTSEMISAKGLLYNNTKTLSLLSFSIDERPFSVQLFGNNPEDFKSAVKIIEPFNPDIIDINMGCPAPKIVNNNSGSALMKAPQLCGEIVYAAKSASKIPVTVKIRTGWDDNSINATQVASICEQAGADAITIHGRTREQMYSGDANLDIIKDVKNCVKIPVIGNGDIISAQSAQKMFDYTGCDLVTVGRGALGNPWIFSQINTWISDGKILPSPIIQERLSVMMEHVNKICEYKGENIGIKEARKHVAWYMKGIKNAAKLRNEINLISCVKELENLCDFIICNEN